MLHTGHCVLNKNHHDSISDLQLHRTEFSESFIFKSIFYL
jgi:hypothetical protein